MDFINSSAIPYPQPQSRSFPSNLQFSERTGREGRAGGPPGFPLPLRAAAQFLSLRLRNFSASAREGLPLQRRLRRVWGSQRPKVSETDPGHCAPSPATCKISAECPPTWEKQTIYPACGEPHGTACGHLRTGVGGRDRLWPRDCKVQAPGSHQLLGPVAAKLILSSCCTALCSQPLSRCPAAFPGGQGRMGAAGAGVGETLSFSLMEASA